MTKWIDLGPLRDFPPGSKNCIKVESKPLVICNVDGELFALANVCPHAGLPLGDGEIVGKVITCPYHGYTYHVQTGRNIDFPNEEPPVPTYPVRTVSGRVAVQLKEG